jgi:hypothetical protein
MICEFGKAQDRITTVTLSFFVARRTSANLTFHFTLGESHPARDNKFGGAA